MKILRRLEVRAERSSMEPREEGDDEKTEDQEMGGLRGRPDNSWDRGVPGDFCGDRRWLP